MRSLSNVFSLPLIIGLGLALLALSVRAGESFKVKVSGHGKPMILIPGLACSAEVWNGTVEHYQSMYECHVVTLAGFAGVEPVDGPFLITMRDALTAYIRGHHLEKPVIVGHSLGGLIGMWIAATEPDLVGQLVIVDSYPFAGAIMDTSMTAERMRSQAQMMQRMITAQTRDQYRQTQPFVLATMMRDSIRIAQVMAWGLESDPATMGHAIAEALTTDLREQVSTIQAPVLALGTWVASQPYGGSKQQTESNYRNQLRRVQNATVAIADSAKHFIMFDDLSWMLTSIDGFLSNSISKK